jgi:hypothetical protein
MTQENDTILIQTLSESFRGQLKRYIGLRDVVRQLLSRIVLSRGDLSQISDGLQKKKELLEAIEAERQQIAEKVEEWQSRKNSISRSEDTDQLEHILEQVTDAIREFLSEEEQLRKYIEGIISTSAT